ncbi:MAG: type II/IV secretion system protein [Gammaproteobacteria bacterium]|nr:type II/IV secretion system protein [Gammaproteobacteria bacterium]
MLGKQLLKAGLIDADQLQIALVEQKKSGMKIGRLLVQFGFISETDLRDKLGKIAGVRSIDLSTVVADAEALRQIPEELARRFRVIPVSFNRPENRLMLAMTEPGNLVALDKIRRIAGRSVQLDILQASEPDIDKALAEFYGFNLSIDGILDELENQPDRNSSVDPVSDGDSHVIVRLINVILADAVQAQASDIHFEPEAGYIRIRYRIDGVLFRLRSLHKKHWPAMVGRLKIQAGMDIAENRMPQDGSFSLTVHGKPIDFRASSFPLVHGENLVLRVLDRNKSVLELGQLVQDRQEKNLIRSILSRPEGVVLVAGPTGSGKTTSLYSMVKELNHASVNIMTLEDPVEYPLEYVRQSNLGQHQSLSFHDGIRAILRQDPDIVLIGEIRDADTARIAMRASMTGHKVFSTIHTRSAIAAVQRLIDLGVEPMMLTGNLSAVISQRLIRKLCSVCGGDSTARKCRQCAGIGYKGRLSLMEILTLDETLEKLILESAGLAQIENAAREKGWVPLLEKGHALVEAGLTDSRELERVFGMADSSEKH